jgi:DNA-binding transcriptional LysR family regulator
MAEVAYSVSEEEITALRALSRTPVTRDASPDRSKRCRGRLPYSEHDARGHGLTLNRASMLIDAAVDGQGVALARTTLAAWDLINGGLVRPFDVGLKLARTYWIVGPKATSAKPKVATFRDWLLAEAADDARRLRKLFAVKPEH